MNSNMPRIMMLDYWHPEGTLTIKKFYPDNTTEILRLTEEEAKVLRDDLNTRYPK